MRFTSFYLKKSINGGYWHFILTACGFSDISLTEKYEKSFTKSNILSSIIEYIKLAVLQFITNALIYHISFRQEQE